MVVKIRFGRASSSSHFWIFKMCFKRRYRTAVMMSHVGNDTRACISNNNYMYFDTVLVDIRHEVLLVWQICEYYSKFVAVAYLKTTSNIGWFCNTACNWEGVYYASRKSRHSSSDSRLEKLECFWNAAVNKKNSNLPQTCGSKCLPIINILSTEPNIWTIEKTQYYKMYLFWAFDRLSDIYCPQEVIFISVLRKSHSSIMFIPAIK